MLYHGNIKPRAKRPGLRLNLRCDKLWRTIDYVCTSSRWAWTAWPSGKVRCAATVFLPKSSFLWKFMRQAFVSSRIYRSTFWIVVLRPVNRNYYGAGCCLLGAKNIMTYLLSRGFFYIRNGGLMTLSYQCAKTMAVSVKKNYQDFMFSEIHHNTHTADMAGAASLGKLVQ